MATKSQPKGKKEINDTVSSEKKSSFAENYGSTILGFVVVLILGSFLFNVFRGNNQNGEIGSGEDTENGELTETPDGAKTHTVTKGEDLWKISEKYYGTGYNWTDIAQANNITNSNQIEEGQTLTIPVVTPVGPTSTPATGTPTTAPSPTSQNTQTTPAEPATPAAQADVPPAPGEKGAEVSTADSYTVAKGDTLWSIAVKEYQSGYKWVDIARANKLVDPDIIHVGNTLTLPR